MVCVCVFLRYSKTVRKQQETWVQTGGVEYTLCCENRWLSFLIWLDDGSTSHQVQEASLVWTCDPRWFLTNPTLGIKGSGSFTLGEDGVYVSKSRLHSIYVSQEPGVSCCHGDQSFTEGMFKESFTTTEEWSFLRKGSERPPWLPLGFTVHEPGIRPSLPADRAAELCEHTDDKI